jgi:hypothetical protein
MKQHREGSRLQLFLEGAIGESTPLFTLPLQDVKELVLDMTKVTYINSIGVKHWILWTLRIPKDCVVLMVNTPFVIASQASIVLGFATPQMKIESIRMPYTCNNCGAEDLRLITRGREYEYASPGFMRRLDLPTEGSCLKCGKGIMEPDFMVEKTFKFLG